MNLARELAAFVIGSFYAGRLFASSGAPPPPTNDWPASPGSFVSLFNGKDLSGWAGIREYWLVKDGLLIGHETKETSKQTFLVFTNATYANFELRWKYRFTTPSGNSGMQFRSRVIDTNEWLVGGYQANFLTSLDRAGSIYDEAGRVGKRGDMSNLGEKTTWSVANVRTNEALGETAEELKKVFKRGDWNDCLLAAHGHRITFTVNDHAMTDLIDDSTNAVREGVIALQLHRGYSMEVQFKDIEIKVVEEK